MRKKHQPGCPCCEEPTGPCGCDSTQIQIDIDNTTDIAQFFGTRFSPGPCTTMDFAGFSAIDGTYYVDWPDVPGTTELGRWASTSGKLTDAMGNAYCCFLKIELIASEGTLPCEATLLFTLYLYFLTSPSDPCPNVDDITIWDATYTDEFGVGVALCVADDDTISIQTVSGINAVDCGAKYWTTDVTVAPV